MVLVVVLVIVPAQLRLRRPARVAHVLLHGIARTGDYIAPRSLAVGAALGYAARAVQCAGFAAALLLPGLALPWAIAFAVAPAAMLIGAAFMLPGGIAITEVATAVVLGHFGVDLERAVLAAVALQLGSIWFAIMLGLAAIAWLEWFDRRAHAGSPAQAT